MRRQIGIALVVLAGSLAGATADASATSAHSTVRMTGGMSPYVARVLAQGGRSISRGNPRAKLTVTVVLRRSRQRAFEAYVRNAAARRTFVSPATQARRFGPSLDTYERASWWLRSHGLRVVQRAANRLSLTATGTRAQVERTFAAPIDDITAAGHRFYTNLRAPAIPTTIAGSVEGVLGLSNLGLPSAPADQHLCENQGSLANTPGNEKFKETCGNLCRAHAEKMLAMSYAEILVEVFLSFLPPVFSIANTAVNGANSAWGLVGYCLGASAGQANPGFGGWASENKGAFGFARQRRPGTRQSSIRAFASIAAPQKIGLLEYDGFNPSDVTDWLAMERIEPAVAGNLHIVSVNGGVPTPGAGESEVLLDIDTAIAGAPLSSYVVYEAPPSTTFVQMFQTMIADGDTVISNSWSQCEDQTAPAEAQAIDSVLASASAGGITVVNGTGDSGSSCLDGSANTIGVPADSPNATAVGGTSPKYGLGLTYGSEAWWNEQSSSPPGGAGGYGVSKVFARPSYQSSLTSSATRSVPDLSFDADPHAGVSICQADAGGCPDGQLWGGTSMSAPAVAAQVADLNEELGHDVGNLNAALYPLAGATNFHTPATMGSDFAHVGLGTPDFNAIYEHLSGEAAGALSTTASRAAAIGRPQSDGAQQGIVRVNLTDAKGLPLTGKHVTLTPSSGTASVSPAEATTSQTEGAAAFTVTDTVAETVSFTVKDTTDGKTLAAKPQLTFVTPTATGATILATPSSVANDGTAKATIQVYLQNGLGRPASGKTVKLIGGGSATVTPGSREAVTNSEGLATFTASDTTIESVGFTATDKSDSELPVPGSALVNFQPEGSQPCADTAPTPTGGSPVTVSPFASGFPDNTQAFSGVFEGITFNAGACAGIDAPTFDSSGNVYVPDEISGQIYEFGPGGGNAESATALPNAVPGLQAIAFGKNGELYATLNHENNPNQPELVELNPTTSAIERVIAKKSTGMFDFPTYMAVDPISGDVFVVDDGGGAGTEHFFLTRVSKPDSASPVLSDYGSVEGVQTGIAFAPDGTLYVGIVTGSHEHEVLALAATNSGSPGTVTSILKLSKEPFGVAVAESDELGHAKSLVVMDETGNVYKADLTAEPATVEQLAERPTIFTRGGATGPDGCFYYQDQDMLLKLAGLNTRCAGGLAGQAPQIELAGSGPASPPTGSTANVTATLTNFPSVSGTAVSFEVTGANGNVKLVRADATGNASFGYSGTFRGIDTVRAFADAAGKRIESAPLEIHWTSGKHTTYLTLNASQESAPLGAPVTVAASLIDLSQTPSAPLAGQLVTIEAAGSQCQASTDASGSASCALTPTAGYGLASLTARFAGSETLTASTATNVMEVGGVGHAFPAIPSPPTAIQPPGGTTPPTPTPKPKATPTLASVLGLPPASSCVSKRRLVVHVHAPSGQRLAGVTFLVRGRKLVSRKIALSHNRVASSTVNLVGLPKGTFTLTIVVKTKSGNTYRAHRTYHTCVRGRKHKR